MKMVGYARWTPLDQDLEDQRVRLVSTGCETVFEDGPRSYSQELPGLDAALSGLNTGDILVVCSLDRLGLSMQNAINNLLDVQRRGIRVRSLNEEIDLAGPTGAMQLRLLAGFGRAQNRLELEQIHAALEVRSARQPKRGPKHKLSDQDLDRAVNAVASGQQTVAGMAKILKVGRNTLSRALNRRPDYLRPSKAQLIEAEKLADEIEAAADRMARRLDQTIEKIDRVMSAEYVAEREKAIREELAANPIAFDRDAVIEVLRQSSPFRKR